MNEVKAAISDWSTPPGSTIRALLVKSSVSTEDFARNVGISFTDAAKLLAGSLVIDALLAQELERAIGGHASFWLKREADFRADRDANESLNPHAWLKTLPVKEMRRWGWMDSSEDDLTACKNFFGVSTVREWRIKYDDVLATSSFRRTTSSDEKTGLVSAWLRFQEVQARHISCGPWSADGFKASFDQIKSLTFERDPGVFIPKLREICAKSGVALVVARAPSGSTVSGAAMFVDTDRAALCLSFRHLSDDHLWFTFFHEAGHLLLHRSRAAHVDDDGTKSTDRQEEEANQFASETILPNEMRRALISAKDNKFAIVRLAKKLNVCPGLLVGQLQKGGYIPYNRMNSLKRRYNWANL